MNQAEIMKILPHRDDMLLVDEAYVDGTIAHGKKRIRGDEYFLRGHFPNNPVVPGVILCEMMAQAACVLFPEVPNTVIRLLTGLDKVRFKRQVKPGDLFETECTLTKSRGGFYFIRAKGFVEGRICASAELSFALMEERSESSGEG